MKVAHLSAKKHFYYYPLFLFIQVGYVSYSNLTKSPGVNYFTQLLPITSRLLLFQWSYALAELIWLYFFRLNFVHVCLWFSVLALLTLHLYRESVWHFDSSELLFLLCYLVPSNFLFHFLSDLYLVFSLVAWPSSIITWVWMYIEKETAKLSIVT